MSTPHVHTPCRQCPAYAPTGVQAALTWENPTVSRCTCRASWTLPDMSVILHTHLVSDALRAYMPTTHICLTKSLKYTGPHTHVKPTRPPCQFRKTEWSQLRIAAEHSLMSPDCSLRLLEPPPPGSLASMGVRVCSAASGEYSVVHCMHPCTDVMACRRTNRLHSSERRESIARSL